MLLLITYMVLAIVISFLCSVMEAVLLSITPSYIGVLRKENEILAKRVQTLKDNIDQPLSAILTLNTVAHTAGAAGVGAQAAVVFSDAAVGIASAIMTLLVLVLSEIIPKTLGATYWRALTPSVSISLVFLVKVFKPFVWLADRLTRLLGKKEDEAHYIRQEIEVMAELGSKAGALNQDESDTIRSLLNFRTASLKDVMTPQTVLFKVHKDMTVDEYLSEHGSVPFSRVLVYDEDGDDVIGFVHKNDLMLAYHRVGHDYRVGKLVKSLYTVPETLSAPSLFQNLLQRREHIALVVDEYGAVQGIVTLEDLLESLIGVEIVDEHDRVSDMQAEAQQLWRERLESQDKIIDSSGLTTETEEEQKTD
ncbi:hemolysin family protein [Pseudoteredinibacter isoporae]|uniref:CBS domain containing-hemolysin-like protein n=1 Tax=Pseudoteredinibacter isoporae TaxID=570281 RepID=A0A7X0MUW4_9GAMM|nr:hemolysin family protein [Pseudoteredinibacter isoporae]MBB6520728.1 CBS domain containing-hemolysin-like protein [Pseudoteredinibacter isoporae]NHO86295.1 HlyC/CorC family transporter [Pseudoteredinibacter isoporae]NIB25254.1 HlyC/CorC family transporter [Pseudoteredinibacter isoporae]